MEGINAGLGSSTHVDRYVCTQSNSVSGHRIEYTEEEQPLRLLKET